MRKANENSRRVNLVIGRYLAFQVWLFKFMSVTSYPSWVEKKKATCFKWKEWQAIISETSDVKSISCMSWIQNPFTVFSVWGMLKSYTKTTSIVLTSYSCHPLVKQGLISIVSFACCICKLVGEGNCAHVPRSGPTWPSAISDLENSKAVLYQIKIYQNDWIVPS